jgi:hypothetical protein
VPPFEVFSLAAKHQQKRTTGCLRSFVFLIRYGSGADFLFA